MPITTSCRHNSLARTGTANFYELSDLMRLATDAGVWPR
jgi:hypothetical protein